MTADEFDGYVTVTRATAEALDSARIFGEIDGAMIEVERVAWIVRQLRYMPDEPTLFPHGKWATIQSLDDRIEKAAEKAAARYCP